MNYSKVFTAIISHLQNYIKTSRIKALVIGQSGGIDSAMVSLLAHKACKSENIPLIARYIHIESNKLDEQQRATLIGENFATNFKAIDLTNLYSTVFQEIEENPEDKSSDLSYRIRLGNIKARIRMIYLYNLAQQNGGLVLSTDNWTEYLLGFWTLHGDVGDYAPIQTLWKTEVYELANYCCEHIVENEIQKTALKRCIDATPTDGLGTTASDLEQLKAISYHEVDQLLIRYTENGDRNSKLLQHPVIDRHLKSYYKRKLPISIERHIITE